MSRPMPVRDYRWLSVEEMDDFDVLTEVDEADDATTGYFIDVTLEYGEHYHVTHNSMPLAAERLHITGEMLSNYARGALEKTQKKKSTSYKADKLSATFRPRERYVCHGVNLKFYLQMGMRIVKVHRIMTFTQEPFIRPYIDFCASMRAKSKSKSRSNIFKLAANAVSFYLFIYAYTIPPRNKKSFLQVYGKMIENSSNRMDTYFVQSRMDALKRATDPRFKSSMILGDDLSISFMAKKEEKLNQLWNIGFSILELSKVHMLKLFYNVIRPTFNGKASILVSDTDSYIAALGAPTVDHAIGLLKDAGHMDTSNYPKDHPLFSEENKNVPGLLKNECPADDLIECVGVRSKVYAIRSKKSMDSRCKGVKKAVRKMLRFEDFKTTVLGPEPKVVSVVQHTIQSKNHLNRLLRQEKVAMSSFDDKRFLAVCGIHSYPYGSRLIEQEEYRSCFFCKNPRLFA